MYKYADVAVRTKEKQLSLLHRKEIIPTRRRRSNTAENDPALETCTFSKPFSPHFCQFDPFLAPKKHRIADLST